jgi:hypothetical protein
MSHARDHVPTPVPRSSDPSDWHRMRIRPAVPCHARKKSGEPCRAFAIVGGLVCRAHGGAAPQVREAARKRLILTRALAGLARYQAKDRARQEALAPWSRTIQRELVLSPFDPNGSAQHLRAVVREMASVESALRTKIRALEEAAPTGRA